MKLNLIRIKKLIICTTIISMSSMLITSCGSSSTAVTTVSTETAPKMTPHEATDEQKAQIMGYREQAAAGKVSTTLDQKFVNTHYMVTGLLNSDCMMQEADDSLEIYVPSGSAMIQIKIVPGIQSTKNVINTFQQYVTDNFSQEGTGGTFQSTLMGYNATIFPFTAQTNGATVNGFTSAFIANQSLYNVNLLYYSTASENELDLIAKILPSLQVLKPASVDKSTKKASYTDPYASYKVFDPYLYYYISGEWTYDDYLAAFESYYDETDLTTWDDLPYSYYSWYEGDYSGYTADDFAADYNYYDDSDYWNWGWDDTTDWSFYDDYADDYSEDAYASLDNYYDSSDEDTSYTADESYDFSDADDTWASVDLTDYDESTYDYSDYYDSYYYGDSSSSDDSSSYDDSGSSDDSGSYDDSGSSDDSDSYDDSGDSY